MEKINNTMMKTRLVALAVLTVISSAAIAESVPNTFSAGQAAVAEHVNENFTHVTDRLDINEDDISDLDTRVKTLEDAADPTSTTLNIDCSADDSIFEASF